MKIYKIYKNFLQNNFKFLITIFSLTVFLLAWQIIAHRMNASLILPLPKDVFCTLINLCGIKVFWQNFMATTIRIFISFFISVVLGSAIGFLCAYFEFVKIFFEVPLAIIRATPVVAFILLAVFWFKSGTIPIFVSVVMTLPIIITAVQTGFASADKKLYEMANVFCFSRLQKFRYIALYAVRPYFFASLVSCFGLSWKVVVAGEVISLPQKACGTILQTAQVHLESRSVIAITIMIVGTSFLFEKIFTFCVKKYLKNPRAKNEKRFTN